MNESFGLYSPDHRVGATVAPRQAEPIKQRISLCESSSSTICCPNHTPFSMAFQTQKSRTGAMCAFRWPCPLELWKAEGCLGGHHPFVSLSSPSRSCSDSHPKADCSEVGAKWTACVHSTRRFNSSAFKRSMPSNWEMVICYVLNGNMLCT